MLPNNLSLTNHIDEVYMKTMKRLDVLQSFKFKLDKNSLERFYLSIVSSYIVNTHYYIMFLYILYTYLFMSCNSANVYRYILYTRLLVKFDVIMVMVCPLF